MISAVILTKNEEKNIERCIKSLRWCGEVLVIDDFSSDQTVKLARKLKAKVIQRNLNNNFSDQRNYGLEIAQNKWILFVDADEEVTLDLAKEILNAITHIEYKGFRVRRNDYLWGKRLTHGDIGRFNYVRLGLRGTGTWKRRVDEIWAIEGRIGQLKNPLRHYPHQTLTEFFEEINYKSTLNARQLFEEGRRTTFLDWFKPPSTFFRSWIVKGGFLDGMPGFVVSAVMSLHSFLVRSKLYLLTKNGPPEK